MAAVDYFLKLASVEGETTDEKRKGEMDLESWSWGESQSGTSGLGGGAGAGKVQPKDFSFLKRVDKASPNLFIGCATGTHYKEAVLTARKAGQGQQEYFTITMTDVLISSYLCEGSPQHDGVPMDRVSLNFSKLKMEYKLQKPDGSLAAGPIQTYDFSKNVKV